MPLWKDEALPAVTPPDLNIHAAGNTGIAYAWSFTARVPGPHVLVNALMHGNELCGAIALDRLLRAGIRPCRGTLSFTFANIDAFAQFHPRYPALGRFVAEDMNRLWSPAILAGSDDSAERRRVRSLWPLLATADRILDLHSMLHDRTPLMLAGQPAKAVQLARQIGLPGWIVTDPGHAAGPRLIDHPRFGDPGTEPVALLLECGQHSDPAAVAVALATTARFLAVTGAVAPADLAPWLPLAPTAAQILVQVTETITAMTEHFRFTNVVHGMDIIPKAGTVIAHDGDRPILSPYDDCILVMPAQQPVQHHTAVRLGRRVG